MGGGPLHRKLRMCHNMVHQCSKERVGELMVGKLGVKKVWRWWLG